jgi:HEAT repeat protein
MFWISTIVATVLGAAVPSQSLLAQPAPAPAAADAVPQDVAVLTNPKSSQDQLNAAARNLVARRTDQSRDAIRNILSDPNLQPSQVAVAQALADDPDPQPAFKDPLFVMLASNVTSSGLAAAEALGTYKTGPIHGEVLNRLQANATGGGPVRTEQSRRMAITGLGYMVDKSAADTLMRLLTSSNEPQIRRVAAEALASLSGQSRIGEDIAGWQQWWAANQNKTEPQFRDDLLTARANDFDALKRHNADVESKFATFVNDEYQLTPPAQRGEKLLAYLTAPNAIMRAEGARIMRDDKVQGSPVPPSAQKQLTQMIDDPDPRVRFAVADALAALNDKQALAPIIAQLAREEDPAVRAALTNALGQIGDTAAVPTLLDLLGNGNDVVAASAAEAMQKLGSKLKDIPAGQARDAAKKLQALLVRPGASQSLREKAIGAMTELRDPSLLQAYRDVLNNPNESSLMKQRAIHGIGNIGDPKTADDIGTMLRDPDAGIKTAAVEEIAKVNGINYVRKLVEMLQPSAEAPDIQDKAWVALQFFLSQLDTGTLQDFADKFKDKAPDKRARLLDEKQTREVKSTDPKEIDDRPLTLQNLGETQMELQDYNGAAASYGQAIVAIGDKLAPSSAQMIQLIRANMKALLRAGKYSDAIKFAETSIKNDSSQDREMSTLIVQELKDLMQDGSPSALKKALELIDEAQKLQNMPPKFYDDLRDFKNAIDQRTAKEKGSGSVPVTPVPFRATINNGASAEMPKRAE